MQWLRWVNLGVAMLAGILANLSGALYAELEPETPWGPWAYVGFAWATSALAFAAWLPKPLSTRALVVGAVASAAWLGYMLRFEFLLNVAGHLLAAVFFAATAWEDKRGTDAGKTGVARWMARALWWPAVAALWTAALFMPIDWAMEYQGSGMPTPAVLVYAGFLGALAIVSLLAAKPSWRTSWMRPVAVAGAAALAVLTPQRYIDPNVGLLAAAAAFGACSVAMARFRGAARASGAGRAAPRTRRPPRP